MQPLSKSVIKEKLDHYERKIITDSFLTKSAVLIPILKSPNGPELLFTKRTEMVEHHKGQISFPGGAVDKSDASPVDTALRESFEEVGIDRSFISVVGMMDDLQTPSGFIITPVVGFIEALPPLRINADEVAQVVRIPLERFYDETKRRSETKERNGMKVEIFFYDVWTEPIWGATAFFVKRLVDLLQG